MNLIAYVLLGVGIALVGSHLVNRRRVERRVAQLLRDRATVLDVRSAAEYSRGHRVPSINIPLAEIPSRADELDRERAIIVCCASGARAALAARWLVKQGYAEVVNAGSWRNVT